MYAWTCNITAFRDINLFIYKIPKGWSASLVVYWGGEGEGTHTHSDSLKGWIIYLLAFVASTLMALLFILLWHYSLFTGVKYSSSLSEKKIIKSDWQGYKYASLHQDLGSKTYPVKTQQHYYIKISFSLCMYVSTIFLVIGLFSPWIHFTFPPLFFY